MIFKNRIILLAFGLQIIVVNEVLTQTREWEFDKTKSRSLQTQQRLDSIMTHMENRWEVGLSYGLWFFNSKSKSMEEELFQISNPINAWELSGTWHFKESFGLEFSMGFFIKIEKPATPDFNSIINGDDIDVEGFGLVLIPLDVGLKYYFSQKRFKPLFGVNVGLVAAKEKSTTAAGNINTGINRVDQESSGKVLFGKIKGGFDYRLGQRTNFTLNASYSHSKQFKEAFGGYLNYNGFSIGTGVSIIF